MQLLYDTGLHIPEVKVLPVQRDVPVIVRVLEIALHRRGKRHSQFTLSKIVRFLKLFPVFLQNNQIIYPHQNRWLGWLISKPNNMPILFYGMKLP